MAGNKYLNEQGLGHLWERIKIYTSSTYLSLTGGNVTGPVNFGDSVYISDLNTGNFIATGNAAFTNNIQANTINGVEVGSNPKFTDTWNKVSTTQDGYVTKLPGGTTSFLRGDGSWATPPDTTYVFDGTYNSSTNKVATVNTVTNAINNLDGNLNNTTPGVGKTLTAFSQTNGKISATFGNISITKSQVSDFAHEHSQIVTVGDKRNQGTTPNSYRNNLIFQGLKANPYINNPSTDIYSYLAGLRGWSDSSGGNSHEIAFNNSGIFVRQGATTVWGDWEKVLTDKNITEADITKALGGNQNVNVVFAGPSSGSAATPSFRALDAADIPSLAWSKITSGNDDLKAIEALTGTSGLLKKTAANTWTLDTSTYLTGITSSQVTSALGFTPYNATNPNGYTSNTGTVTSVQVQANSPLQSSTSTAQNKTLNTTISFIKQNANVVLAGPSSGSTTASPTFRALVEADIPSLSKSKISDFPTSWDLSNISGADNLKKIEALTGTNGLLKKTAANTWSLDTNTYLTAATLPAASTSTAGITKVGASGGAAAYDHVHGYLTNAGAITTTATIASGDKLVIVDSNDSSKINGSSITFGSDQTKFLTNKGTWVVPTGTYSLPTATSSTLGGIKIGYTENGKNYPVELSNGQAYVNVPWTDNNTTYIIETGDANGQIKVTPSSGDVYNVSVKGLGSNAYTSTEYLPLTGGTLSGDLTVGTTSQSAAPTGAIHVHDIRNYTIPPNMLSKGVNWFFSHGNQMPTTNWWAGMHINGWEDTTKHYTAWELVGPSANDDQRTTPLYVRTGRTTEGWSSWRKIYDSSNVPTKSELGLGDAAIKGVDTTTLTVTSTTNLPTSKAVADFVNDAKGTLTFAMDTTDTKKLIITYSH